MSHPTRWLCPLALAFSLSAAAADPGGLLLVANQGDRALSVVDPNSAKPVAKIAEGAVTGHEVIASADGKTAYVPIYGDSGVGKPGSDGTEMVVIDLATMEVKNKVDFGHGVRPHCPMINPKDGMLYVTTELDESVTVIDPKTLKIVGAVPTGQKESHMLAISHDGRRGYTANVGAGSVSVLDLQNRKTVAVIPISRVVQRISITPDDKLVFTADQTKPQMVAIDTATNKVKSYIPLAATGYGTASTPDGKWLLVAVPSAAHVAVVDLQSMQVVRTIDVPKAPQEVLIAPDNKTAYVSCNATGKVAAINLADWSVQHIIETGKLADGLAWAKAN